LVGRKDSRDRVTTALLERQKHAESREEANLLYVALTRARQLMIVSAAVTPDKAGQGWYGMLRAHSGIRTINLPQALRGYIKAAAHRRTPSPRSIAPYTPQRWAHRSIRA